MTMDLFPVDDFGLAFDETPVEENSEFTGDFDKGTRKPDVNLVDSDIISREHRKNAIVFGSTDDEEDSHEDISRICVLNGDQLAENDQLNRSIKQPERASGDHLPNILLKKRKAPDSTSPLLLGQTSLPSYFPSAVKESDSKPTSPSMKPQNAARTTTVNVGNSENIKDLLVPTYFVMKGEASAVFRKEAPSGLNTRGFKAEILWPEQQKTLILYADMPSDEFTYQEEATDPYPRHCLPLLCSHLQTCIRAGKPPQAARTAYELMRVDMVVFLRKLLMFVLLEAVPNPDYPAVVWLLCAVKEGFRLPTRLREWLLGLVLATASSDFRDLVDAAAKLQPVHLISRTVIDLPSTKRDLIYALQLAKVFQSDADKAVIDELTHAWIRRMSTGDPYGTTYVRTCFTVLGASLIGMELDIDEWDLSAMNAHSSEIVDMVRHEMTSDEKRRWPDDAVIKRAISDRGTVANRRAPISPDAQPSPPSSPSDPLAGEVSR
ncbi:hypothetical protein PhCBS80983_g02558 [Powellomyces hirtus]|uniref:Uncharacterized protein n=1 Tax=Powellomyces hirtus TaxID=109895 RepID=A0A507E8E6_9FUNG|nr:hypothetical protein PhCBS80983_g02558 [Powellomyces hirtus]